MHDLNELLADDTDAVRRLARRGYELDVEGLRSLGERRRSVIGELEGTRAAIKAAAGETQRAARAGEDLEPLKARGRELKETAARLEAEVGAVEEELRERLLVVPNLPLDELPDGHDETAATLVRTWGEPPSFDFEARDHVDLAESLGIFDFARATKLAGPRFVVGRGLGARLERGLAAFLLDLQTTEHGYEECSVPHLVTPRTMTGTGQLPKFEEDLFKTAAGERDLYLIPTSEVPLTNLYADEIVAREQLPIALTTHSPCYRSEAGSYGRDTRGLIRLHQFAKVEMVRLCHPDEAREQLELMVGHAEACLRALGLAHRTILLPAGDTGFSSQITYDLEVWLPGQQAYREISSCSSCGTFQARRAGIRWRGASKSERGHVATLNGSGLPIGRTVAALLEQGQQADGSVVLPDVLEPYLGFSRLTPPA